MSRVNNAHGNDETKITPQISTGLADGEGEQMTIEATKSQKVKFLKLDNDRGSAEVVPLAVSQEANVGQTTETRRRDEASELQFKVGNCTDEPSKN